MKTKSNVWIFPILLILYEFAVNLSNDMYLPGLPDLARDLSISMSTAQLTVSIWLVGSALAQFILGPLADAQGRRFVLLGGGLLFLISTWVCSSSNQIEWILMCRFLQGMAVCSLMVAGYATIHELFDDQDAIRVLSWMGSAAVVAPLIGPLLGSWILTASHWRMIFKVLFLLGLFPFFGLCLFMPETNRLKNRRAISLQSMFQTYLELFQNRIFIASALSSGLLYSGIMIWLTASSFLMIESMGISRNIYGILQIPIFSGYILGAAIVRQGLVRFGSEKIIQIGMILAGGSALAFFLSALLMTPTIVGLVIPMTGYSMGFGLCAAPLNRITLTSTEVGKGSACAIFYLCMGATGALGSLLVSYVGSTSVRSISPLILIVSILAWIMNSCRSYWAFRQRGSISRIA